MLILAMMLAAIAGEAPPLPPPPKRKPDPEPDPVDRFFMAGNSMGKTYRIVVPGFTREHGEQAAEELKARLSDAYGQEVILDGVEWKIGVDHAAETPPLRGRRVFDGGAIEGTFTLSIDHPPRHRPLEFPPWAPPRRVADPEKKRARKAQKRARRAGR